MQVLLVQQCGQLDGVILILWKENCVRRKIRTNNTPIYVFV
jgi:hypothetical protein